MSDLRIKALELALGFAGVDATVDQSVKRAEAYLAFLQGSTALTAPTPTASPLAGTDPEPARLDDPKVQAEAEAVIDRPTVSGDGTSPQTDAAQGSAGSPTSDATAGSGSPSTAAGEGVPVAAGASTPPIGEVNAAVLAFNRKNGREKTVALLAKYGGSKVPEIDASKHADLLVELKAGVA